ncbi:hypothetical protein [Streptomyces sp. NPDC093568]|uniref:hypothetical protein n=1 Tax=Streptomyces sp. NPDC093568 TaxID=3366041 RepID=UPI0037F51C37
MRGHPLRVVSKICLMVALLGLALPTTTASASASASASAQTIHRRTAVLGLSGTLLFTGPEPVDVTGSIRITVVTRTEPGGGGTAQITSQLRNTTGVGQDSGGLYHFVGTDNNVVEYPPGPISPLAVFPTFLKIYPPDPILPPHPIQPVRVLTTIDQDGTIDNITAEISNFEPDNP